MTVKARIVSIRLIEKINRLPEYASRIGLTVDDKGREKTHVQQKRNVTYEEVIH